MNSKTLFTWLTMIGFFAGAFAFLALRPDPALKNPEVVKRAARILGSKGIKNAPLAKERSQRRDRQLDSKWGSFSPSAGHHHPLFRDSWGKYSNQLQALRFDSVLEEKLGNTEESRLIRLALAIKTNVFQNQMSSKEADELYLQISDSLRSADVPVFQGMQILIVESFKDAEFDAERSALRSVLSDAAKENSYARMIVQDLIMRELYQDPKLSINDVVARYEIDSSHPLYGVLMNSFNRRPASVGH